MVPHNHSEIDRAVASDILVFNTVVPAEEIEANVFLQQVMSKGMPVF